MNVTIAPGDGIGPEIMDVVLDVFRAAGVPLRYEVTDEPEGPGAAARTGVLLRGPRDAASGRFPGGYAEKRIYRMLPGVPVPIGHRPLGLTIVRERIADGYETVEEMVGEDVARCHRFATRSSARRVHRYAFEMAARKGAKRVTCAHQADVMQLTDGMFLEAFDEVAQEYPDLVADAMTVDRLAMKLVVEPETFDVVVLPDTPGNVIPDLAAGIVGGLTYVPSATIADGVAVFETVHGPAHDAVGQDRANPVALLLAGTMMLRHLELVDHAARIETAVDRALLKMHRSAEVLEHVSRFHTSVFRHLVLQELRKEPLDGAGERRARPASAVSTRRAAAPTSRTSGLALSSIGRQLEGLA